MWKKISKNEEVENVNPALEVAMNFISSGIDLATRTIEIRADVSEGMGSYITRALLKMSQMSNDPIDLYLSSPGGDAYEGFAIYDAIVACPCEVRVIASGKIMSAAFLIILAGDVRVAAKNTTFMMHSVSYDPGDGKTKDHEVNVNEAKRINNAFLDIAAERTRRNRKWWARAILNQDRYFNAAEALELGVLTPAKSVVKSRITKKVSKKARKK